MSREIRCWDSSTFLAYFQAEAERIACCEAALEEAEAGKVLIVTCALTLAEVLAIRGQERLPPTPEMKRKVVNFFKNEYISVQNVTRQVAELARDLVWENGIDPKDAVHIASALAVDAPVFETFDKSLISKSGTVAALIVREPPPPKQGKLF